MVKYKKISLLLFLGFFVFTFSGVSQTFVYDLKCEMLKDPLSIDTTFPRFSWKLKSEEFNIEQKSYFIEAASSLDLLLNNKADLWISGEVNKSNQLYIPYEGKPLSSRYEVFWRVKVKTNKSESEWSKPSFFSVGLLNSDDWKAKWIGLDKAFPWDDESQHSRLSARYFRKEFESNKPIKNAKVYISGLGLYELYINGDKIGDQVLAPLATDYEKSVMYNCFNVTKELKQGKNALGVTLGNGRYYNMRQKFKPHKVKTFGYPKLLFQLEIEYEDGDKQVVVSDKTWKVTADGPIRSNNDFDGEDYDATKELTGWNKQGYNDRHWLTPEWVDPPKGFMTAQMTNPMIVHETIKPISIKQLNKDTIIVDMGQNMVGWARITVRGNKGDLVTLRFAETLDENGRLKRVNFRSAKATDTYTLKGGMEEVWEPRFVTHGFRYVEITGYPGILTADKIVGRVVYDDMETIGSFETSNLLLNKIYQNAFWGIRGNYKGMPIDCPQRDERQPWLGDRATGSTGESFIFDNRNLYTKWLKDIEQSQKEDGRLSDIAPPFYMTYYSDNITWPSTYLFVANMLNKQFGDQQAIKEHYPSMKKWLMYMKENYLSEDYIITKDKYGDWCVPPESEELIHTQDPNRQTDGKLLATAYYFKLLQLIQEFAQINGKNEDAVEFKLLADSIKDGFNQMFFDPEVGQYGNYTVTSNLLPLALGMVDKKYEDIVFKNMIDRIVRNDKMHISTGVIGIQWLMRELSKRGCVDLAYTIATQTDYPGWGYMIKNGATTIWELWNGDTANPKMNSHNHVMLLGDLVIWMYEDLAGIKTHPRYSGFKNLWMKPNPTEDLSYVNSSYKTPYGKVTSNWRIEGKMFLWNLKIPVNTRSNILIPSPNIDHIRINGKKYTEIEGVKFVRIEENRINLEIGSGSYVIETPYGEVPDRWKQGVMVEEFICENPPFPESHAATIAETNDGTLVASWFGGTKERNPDVCIWVSRLENNKWTEPMNVANGIINDTLRYACWNPVLYQVPNGELQLYYKVGPNVAGWVGKVITSNDRGVTWSDPKDLPDGFLGPIKNKPVLLDNGVLLSPSSTEGNGWKIHFEATKDWGKTWKKIGPINDGREYITIQPSILVHGDNKLQILCRSRNRAIIESWSYDNGKTWTPMKKSMLPNGNSGTDAVTLQNGNHLLVYNHVLPHDTLKNGKGLRTPLNAAISEDGKTWYATNILEDSPISQYSYPSVIQSKDGMVHIVYTWRRKAIKYVKLDPSKLIWSKIEDRKWPSMTEGSEVQIVNNKRYKISVCDWMMLKRQKIGAIQLAREVSADGLEIDMGGLGKRVSFDNKFTEKHFQELFISECNKHGIEFSSLAMSAFYGQSFAKRDNYEDLIDEAINTMKVLGIKVAFLPMGNQSDLVKEPELYPIVLERLKVVAEKAEAAGVVIGIETTLSAKEEAKLIDKINSPGVRSYVNFSSILKRGGNIIKDLKTLGKKRIVQIHASNTDGHWIENDPDLDMEKIKKTLDKMGWEGWLVVERSRDTNDVHNVKKNFGANVKYLKSIFYR